MNQSSFTNLPFNRLSHFPLPIDVKLEEDFEIIFCEG